MKTPIIIAITALVAWLGTSAMQAQRGPQRAGGRGWGANATYTRLYDARTVETLRGEVLAVERFTPGKGMSAGVHLTLKTEKETIPVHLGPSWFIDNQDSKIEARDKIEVKGSRINFEGKPAIIAAEVKKGDEVLKLRDDAGVPAWAGWRKR